VLLPQRQTEELSDGGTNVSFFFRHRRSFSSNLPPDKSLSMDRSIETRDEIWLKLFAADEEVENIFLRVWNTVNSQKCKFCNMLSVTLHEPDI
jgi:hypothetical protein